MTQESISEQVTRLAGDALSAQARIVRESVEVGREAWSPGADPAALSKAWTELVTEEGQRYWQSVAAIGLDAARSLLALNTRSSAAVLRTLSEASGARTYAARTGQAPTAPQARAEHHHDEHHHDEPHHGEHVHHSDNGVRRHDTDSADSAASGASGDRGSGGGGGSGADEAPRETAPAVGTVNLAGVEGSTVRGSITVANHHPRARRITVTASPLSDAATGEPCGAVVEVSPTRVTVPAGEERRVELTVSLVDGVLAGRAYVGVVEVSGGAQARIDVVVSVDPAP